MSTSQKIILIIEDEKPMAKALEIKLEKAGFETKTAFNGNEAIVFLKKEPFDLVLLDLILPKTDGFAVLAKIKELGISTPIVVLSNLSQEEDVKRAIKLGAKEFFIKTNISLEQLVDHMKELLA